MALKKVGAAWKKTDKNGSAYLSAEFEPEGRGGPKFHFLIFPNKPKDGQVGGKNYPTHTLHMSDDAEETRRVDDDSTPF